MQQTIKNLLFVQGLPENLNMLNDDSFIDSRYPSLIILDDLMRDATNSNDVCELFVEGSHHRNLSVACIMQNAFSKEKESRTMSINSIPSKKPRVNEIDIEGGEDMAFIKLAELAREANADIWEEKVDKYMNGDLNEDHACHNYKRTFHRTIDMAPAKDTISKETNLWWKMYWPKRLQPKTEKVRKDFRFKIDDKVLITYIRNPFTREYDQKWSGVIFKISQRILRGGVQVDRLIGFQDE
ncbi:unnamed protein product [Mytilus edulis]|uniref:Uncharacterized protein n=1 Tax=Mytilus edulis TaxID=6550 RepID=A0A8S3V7F0_MYTED|nr:unnamed protein product [Mytilus edulis]